MRAIAAAILSGLIAFVPPVLAQPVAPPSLGGSRVVGGKPVAISERPWQVALIRDGQQICGGSLVAPRWVLTAAHCLEEASGAAADPDVTQGYEVLEGTDDLRRGGVHHPIDRMIVHPAWTATNFQNDIAVLHLATPSSSAVLSLADDADLAAGERDGRGGVVTGWGLRHPVRRRADDGRIVDAATGRPIGAEEFRQDYATTRLLEADVPLVPEQLCRQAYGSRLGEHELCAGLREGGHDACQGDSGGPLIIQARDRHWVQAGIVSWGEGCGAPGKYGVYTSIPAYRDWVLRLIGSGCLPLSEARAVTGDPGSVIIGDSRAGVSVNILRFGDRAATALTAFRPGEQVMFRVSSARAGYLIVIDVKPDGTITQLYPNALTRPRRAQAALRSGQSILIPDPADPYDRARFTMPASSGSVYAVVADQQIAAAPPAQRDLTIASAAPATSSGSAAVATGATGLARFAQSLQTVLGSCPGDAPRWAGAVMAYVITP